VFCTRTGRPLSQSNVNRELRNAQRRARTAEGEPTFPVLHDGRAVPRGAMPTFHAFRHTAASYAIAEGESAEDVA
jgi:integrase